MKHFFVFLAIFAIASIANAQTSRDTVNGWYLWKAEGPAVGTTWSYICDTTAVEGACSQAFGFANKNQSATTTYYWRKSLKDKRLLNSSFFVLHARSAKTIPSSTSLVGVDLYVQHADTLLLAARGAADDTWARFSSTFFVSDSISSVDAFVIKISSAWLDSGIDTATILLDELAESHYGWDFETIDRFGDPDIAPKFEVNKKTLDFGQVTPNSSKIEEIAFQNTGDDGLIISSITITNQRFTISDHPWYMGSGDSVPITVTFTPESIGVETGMLIITSNSPTSPDTIFLSGRGDITDDVDDHPNVPMGFSLSQNYPNPFNPSTTIRFTLPSREHVNLVVCNLLGQEVATLASGVYGAGEHAVTFNGSSLPSGTYLYRLTAGTHTAVKKMILIK